MLIPHRRRHSESGQVLLFTALVFVFVLSGLAAVVGDMVTLSDESAKARDAAFLAAQAGGSAVDLASIARTDYPSSATLALSTDATAECQRAASVADPGISVTCTVSGGVLTVDVSRTIQLPIRMFGSTVVVHAHARGGPAAGTVTAT